MENYGHFYAGKVARSCLFGLNFTLMLHFDDGDEPAQDGFQFVGVSNQHQTAMETVESTILNMIILLWPID